MAIYKYMGGYTILFGDLAMSGDKPTPPVRLTRISVETPPYKTTYEEGETLDLTGMVVYAYYSDGTSDDVTADIVTDPVEGAELYRGTNSVDISYTDGEKTKSTKQPITVEIEVVLESIAVTTPPTKVAYYVGDTLDLTGMVVTATYSDGTTAVVTNGCVFDPANGTVLQLGQNSVSISYTENGVTKTTSQSISVEEVVLEYIAVTTIPSKIAYREGERLTLTGMVVTATYSDGSTRDVTSLITTNPAEGTRVYIGLTSFTISYTEDGVTKTTSQSISVEVLRMTCTVKIYLDNTDPNSWGVYLDDAAGMTPGSDEWDLVFGHYPCILQDGDELGTLKTNDFTKYEDGTSAPVEVGKDYMVAFPRRGIKIWKVDEPAEEPGTVYRCLYVSITTEDDKEGYSYLAHTYKGQRCSAFYLGSYVNSPVPANTNFYIVNSLPGGYQTTQTSDKQRLYAEAREDYELSAFYQLVYRQALYLLKYKGYNSQDTIGLGYQKNTSITTGQNMQRGMDCGDSTGDIPVSLFGIENAYGGYGVGELVDGIIDNYYHVYVIDNGDYNESHTGYKDLGELFERNNDGGYITNVHGTNDTGFLPYLYSVGSGTTRFCDYFRRYCHDTTGELKAFVGNPDYRGQNDGVFALNFDYNKNTGSFKSRLMYMKLSSKPVNPPLPTVDTNNKTYTLRLDLTNNDFTSWATYEDDAVGVEEGSLKWDSIFGWYPCILENGVEQGRLDYYDYTQYVNGEKAPIETLGKDVMVCFPRRGIKIESDQSTYLKISITTIDNRDGYSYLAHTYGEDACDKFYLGAYSGYYENNSLYSTSGKAWLRNANGNTATLSNFRTYAENRGDNYEILAYYQLLYIQCMYMMKFKGKALNSGSNSVFNKGYNCGESAYAFIRGLTNKRGVQYCHDYVAGYYFPVKMFGLEQIGGRDEFVDGIMTDSNKQFWVATGNFNNQRTGYQQIVQGTIPGSYTSNSGYGYKIPVGDNNGGFLPLFDSSALDQYHDGGLKGHAIVQSNKVFAIRRDYNYTSFFYVMCYDTPTANAWKCSARLMYMHKR